MLAFLLSLVVSLPYEEAYKNTEENGKPLVVLLTADWCPGCIKVKEQIVPKLKEEEINFTIIEVESDFGLELLELSRSNNIPQLLIFKKNNNVWKRNILIGFDSIKEYKNYLK